MLMASGANFGLRRTIPHALGVGIGFTLMVVLVGVGLMGLFDMFPVLNIALKVVSVAYLLWLAWRIATAPVGLSSGSSRQRPFTFVEGALLQLVNPKLWVMVAGAVVAYGGGVAGDLAIPSAFAVIFGGATLVSTLAWAGIGVGAGRFMTGERSLKRFNRAMALLLVLSLVPIGAKEIFAPCVSYSLSAFASRSSVGMEVIL